MSERPFSSPAGGNFLCGTTWLGHGKDQESGPIHKPKEVTAVCSSEVGCMMFPGAGSLDG